MPGASDTAVGRKSGRNRGANKRAGRIGLLVVCEWWEQDFEQRLEAESLVWGQEERTTPAGGEAHRQRGLGFVVSCGGPGQNGWRTELELCRSSADSSPTIRNSPEKVFTKEDNPSRHSPHQFRVDGGQMSKKNGLADPTRLKPFDSGDKQLLRVVIETPKGSRNKFAFDPEEHIFELKKVLPAGMTFPYDFGFVPSTEADDGDPVDVLVLMDEPAFPGCVLTCRPIGVIEGEQGDKKDRERNDRIVAVEQDAHSWADIKTIDDLGKQFERELEEFFVNYHKLSGKEYRVLGLKGPDQARKLVKSAMR